MDGMVSSRTHILLLCATALLALGLLFTFYGYDSTWRLWNVPTMTPHFADLRTITHGAESWALGLDPMLENPSDPWARTLNYPRVWHALFLLGIEPEQTAVLGGIVMLSFFTGVCLVSPNAGPGLLAMVMAAVLSPAAMFGMERGNTDLFIFLIVAVAISCIRVRPWISTAAVLLAYVLKLFPVFATALLLALPRARFSRLLIVSLVLVLCYAGLTWSDIVQIREGTPRSTALSYGLNVLWMRLMAQSLELGLAARVISWLLAIGALLWFALRDTTTSAHAERELDLDAFRAGAAIYVGTFLVGNNWDYRLVFLVFTIPQLYAWARQSSPVVKLLARWVLVAMFISLWHLRILPFMKYLPNGYALGFYLDELANWLLFLGLARLLVLSMPGWSRRSLLALPSRIGHGETQP